MKCPPGTCRDVAKVLPGLKIGGVAVDVIAGLFACPGVPVWRGTCVCCDVGVPVPTCATDCDVPRIRLMTARPVNARITTLISTSKQINPAMDKPVCYL